MQRVTKFWPPRAPIPRAEVCSRPTRNLDLLTVVLSLHFNGHFSRWTWVSGYQNVSILDFVAAKGDGGGSDYWTDNTCKAPVKLSPPTNQHPTFYRPDALPVARPTVSEH